MDSFKGIEKILSQKMAHWYGQNMGFFPSDVTVTSEGKVFFVRFKDAVSQSEIDLSSYKAGRELLRDLMDRLSQSQFPALNEILYELTGRKLLELQVEVNVALHEKIYLLTIDRPLQE